MGCSDKHTFELNRLSPLISPYHRSRLAYVPRNTLTTTWSLRNRVKKEGGSVTAPQCGAEDVSLTSEGRERLTGEPDGPGGPRAPDSPWKRDTKKTAKGGLWF